MMTTTITHSETQLQLFDNVMLLEDIPEYTLRKGSIGTIVEFLKPGVYEVDFSDNQGQTYAMCSVHEHQLTPVPDSVLEFLEAIENSNVQIGIEDLSKISSAYLNDRFDDNCEFTIEELTARAYPRKAETLSVLVPENVMKSLKKIADRRGTSVDALVRLYLGQCLRKDLSELFKNTVLERTEEVLNQRLDSDQVSEIMQEIRSPYQSRVRNHENSV